MLLKITPLGSDEKIVLIANKIFIYFKDWDRQPPSACWWRPRSSAAPWPAVPSSSGPGRPLRATGGAGGLSPGLTSPGPRPRPRSRWRRSLPMGATPRERWRCTCCYRVTQHPPTSCSLWKPR